MGLGFWVTMVVLFIVANLLIFVLTWWIREGFSTDFVDRRRWEGKTPDRPADGPSPRA